MRRSASCRPAGRYKRGWPFPTDASTGPPVSAQSKRASDGRNKAAPNRSFARSSGHGRRRLNGRAAARRRSSAANHRPEQTGACRPPPPTAAFDRPARTGRKKRPLHYAPRTPYPAGRIHSPRITSGASLSQPAAFICCVLPFAPLFASSIGSV